LQGHAKSGVVFVLQRNETEGLQAARRQLPAWLQNLGHSVNCTFACLECQFHKVTLFKRLRQDQQSAGDREVVQFGSNWRGALYTNCNRD
jgi:hypothetical protein